MAFARFVLAVLAAICCCLSYKLYHAYTIGYVWQEPSEMHLARLFGRLQYFDRSINRINEIYIKSTSLDVVKSQTNDSFQVTIGIGNDFAQLHLQYNRVKSSWFEVKSVGVEINNNKLECDIDRLRYPLSLRNLYYVNSEILHKCRPHDAETTTQDSASVVSLWIDYVLLELDRESPVCSWWPTPESSPLTEFKDKV